MVYILITIITFLLDSIIKQEIDEKFEFGEKKEILRGNIIIEKYYNRGTAFNLFKVLEKVLLAITCTMLMVLVVAFGITLKSSESSILKFGIAILTGGALSNTIDRICKRHVVDYFRFKHLKRIVFNLSDFFIFIGSIIIIIFVGKNRNKE